MNSSANDSFDPTHSSDSGSDGTPDSSSVYAERYSARSLNGTLLADTQLPSIPTTSDALLSDAFQSYFPTSEVADLNKHLLSLGPDAIEEIVYTHFELYPASKYKSTCYTGNFLLWDESLGLPTHWSNSNSN